MGRRGRTAKNKIAKMRPARPTKPAAIPPTKRDVLVLPVAVVVGLGVAEVALIERGGAIVLVYAGTLLVGRNTGTNVYRWNSFVSGNY